MAVVHPCDELSLSAAMDAQAAGLIEPVLFGPRERIEASRAKRRNKPRAQVAIEDVRTATLPRHAPWSLRQSDGEALMKGSLHTDELMGAVVAERAPYRASESHCFLMQTPPTRGRYHYRCGDQHRADVEGQGRHRP